MSCQSNVPSPPNTSVCISPEQEHPPTQPQCSNENQDSNTDTVLPSILRPHSGIAGCPNSAQFRIMGFI